MCWSASGILLRSLRPGCSKCWCDYLLCCVYAGYPSCWCCGVLHTSCSHRHHHPVSSQGAMLFACTINPAVLLMIGTYWRGGVSDQRDVVSVHPTFLPLPSSMYSATVQFCKDQLDHCKQTPDPPSYYLAGAHGN